MRRAFLSLLTMLMSFAVAYESRNLLDTRSYNYRIYNDITNYQSGYSLRPASILFKIRFSLR